MLHCHEYEISYVKFIPQPNHLDVQCLVAMLHHYSGVNMRDPVVHHESAPASSRKAVPVTVGYVEHTDLSSWIIGIPSMSC